MKPIQLILIAVALVAALGAGFLMMNLNNQPAPVVEAAAPSIPTVQVLVATENIPMGNNLTTERLAWQEWPEAGVRDGYITQETAPDAIEEYAPTIARLSFFDGEPIREEKIVRSDSGYLSAILPSGKRAVGIVVTADSTAGGFILPNDYVDVIKSTPTQATNGRGVVIVTETILENVRVLAIDQTIQDEDGEASQVGDTATLELTPEQVEIVAAAKALASQVGGGSSNALTLALRSVEDSGPDAGPTAAASEGTLRRDKVRLIRFGKAEVVQPSN